MKKLGLLAIFCLVAAFGSAQEVKFPAVDASPADILYYPLNAAKDKAAVRGPYIKVVYSRPQKKGREVFGVLEKYDTVWRLGANESTEITFDVNVTIGQHKIKAGRYSLFAIPSKDKWVIIVNRKLDKWGAFTYEEAKDVARITVPVKKSEKVIEAFSMTFTDRADGANLVMGWDTTIAELPILFKK